MTRADMDDVVAAHVQATERAERIGFAAVELHGAHGYLISSFLSPLANRRTDAYGGDRAGRMRFPLEVFAAMRAAWPADKPMGVRLNGTDWDEAGLAGDDAVAFARALKDLGCDFFDVSGGGNSMVRPPLKPGYQAPFAEAVKQATGVPTMAVGMIREPHIAEELVAGGQCDMVAIARGFLYEPRWTWRAAHELDGEAAYPHQYQRANPKLWPQAFADAEEDPTECRAPIAPHVIMVPKRGSNGRPGSAPGRGRSPRRTAIENRSQARQYLLIRVVPKITGRRSAPAPGKNMPCAFPNMLKNNKGRGPMTMPATPAAAAPPPSPAGAQTPPSLRAIGASMAPRGGYHAALRFATKTSAANIGF